MENWTRNLSPIPEKKVYMTIAGIESWKNKDYCRSESSVETSQHNGNSHLWRLLSSTGEKNVARWRLRCTLIHHPQVLHAAAPHILLCEWKGPLPQSPITVERSTSWCCQMHKIPKMDDGLSLWKAMQLWSERKLCALWWSWRLLWSPVTGKKL